MLRKACAWLMTTLLAISLTGCFDGDNQKQKLAKITQQPASAAVTAGSTATFTVAAKGKQLTYQWQRGSTNIAGATSASYTTPVTTGADDGATFRVVVATKRGSVTSSAATLTVNVPPAITTDPGDASITAGETATFSVTATGTRLAYQWQRGTTNIAGATSATYTTPASVVADDGATFRVVVTNAAGTVTSTAATLTVTASGPASTFRTTPMVSDFAQGGMALKADGTVWAWGMNGDGTTTNGTTITPTPYQVQTAAGPLTRINKISAGATFALALDADGHVWTWGTATTLALQTPQATSTLTLAEKVYAGAGGAVLSNVVDVAAGERVAVVLLADGSVLAWGDGEEGSTGQGTTTTQRIDYPTAVPGLSGVAEIAASRNVVVARTADGRVFQWGAMRSGIPGNSLTPDTGTPTQVAGISAAVRIDTNRNTSVAILADGTARIWGSSMWDGVTGAGTGNCTITSLAATTVPMPNAGASSFTSLASLSGNELFVFNGQLYQVGDLIEDTSVSDVCTRRLEAVTGVSGIVGVAKSKAARATHVWTADGRVYGIGRNDDYNLGVGNATLVDGFRPLAGFNLLGAAPTGTGVLTLDFESELPASVNAGTATLTGVQGFAGLGPTGHQFGGNMLRSETGNVVTVTLTDLPPHTSVNLAFLFAAIDSLDGAGTFPAGDYFKVTLDGNMIFREAFANASTSQVQTYLPPPGVELARRLQLGFGSGTFFDDSAYDMGADPQFQLIPHTSSTLTLTFEIESSGLQGLGDESWGIDDLRISINE